MKKSTIILILKIIAAVASAILAVITAQSCSLTADFSRDYVGSSIIVDSGFRSPYVTTSFDTGML